MYITIIINIYNKYLNVNNQAIFSVEAQDHRAVERRGRVHVSVSVLLEPRAAKLALVVFTIAATKISSNLKILTFLRVDSNFRIGTLQLPQLSSDSVTLSKCFIRCAEGSQRIPVA